MKYILKNKQPQTNESNKTYVILNTDQKTGKVDVIKTSENNENEKIFESPEYTLQTKSRDIPVGTVLYELNGRLVINPYTSTTSAKPLAICVIPSNFLPGEPAARFIGLHFLACDFNDNYNIVELPREMAEDYVHYIPFHPECEGYKTSYLTKYEQTPNMTMLYQFPVYGYQKWWNSGKNFERFIQPAIYRGNNGGATFPTKSTYIDRWRQYGEYKQQVGIFNNPYNETERYMPNMVTAGKGLEERTQWLAPSTFLPNGKFNKKIISMYLPGCDADHRGNDQDTYDIYNVFYTISGYKDTIYMNNYYNKSSVQAVSSYIAQNYTITNNQTDKGMWFLPSLLEGACICHNIELIDDIIIKLGGTPLISSFSGSSSGMPYAAHPIQCINQMSSQTYGVFEADGSLGNAYKPDWTTKVRPLIKVS